MLSPDEIKSLQFQRKYFIENGREASNIEWLFSKGTNFTCYLEYMSNQKFISNEEKLNNSIEDLRIILYTLTRPFQICFFYFTLVVFILHKFNFKKPIMKIILVHYIFRSLGNALDRLGSIMSHYFANTPTYDIQGNVVGYECIFEAERFEMHPLRWFITRHLATAFWYVGEIVADWYPLLRTKMLLKGEKSMFLIYLTCGLFNFTKIVLIIYYISLGPSKLYDKHGVFDKNLLNVFYYNYWIIQLMVLYTSIIYDITVFMILKKKLNEIKYNTHSFLNKFRTISEFRIVISVGISIIFLPILSIPFYINFYYHKSHDNYLEFSLEEIRKLVANVQYYMIFIDQILLILTRKPCLDDVNMKNLGNIKSPKNNDLEEPNDIKLENQERIDLYLNRSIEDVNRMIYDKNFGNENVPNYNSDNFIINTRLNFNDEDIEKNPSPH